MLGQAVGSGVQVLFLKYSRDDETQADDLGLRYMSAAGYAPTEMPHVFHTLARQTEESPRARACPSGSRRTRRRRTARAASRGRSRSCRRRSATGRVDAAPSSRRSTASSTAPTRATATSTTATSSTTPVSPSGCASRRAGRPQNLPTSVVGVSPEQDAAFQLLLAKEKDADSAAAAFFAKQGIQARHDRRLAAQRAHRGAANFSAATQQGTVRGRIAFVELGKHVYQLIGFAPQQSYSANAKLLADSDRQLRAGDRPEVPGREALARAGGDAGRATSPSRNSRRPTRARSAPGAGDPEPGRERRPLRGGPPGEAGGGQALP